LFLFFSRKKKGEETDLTQRSKGRCERRPVVFATGNDFKTGVVGDNTNNGVKGQTACLAL